ncbi:DNA mismatch repair protein MutS [Suicoccus acidiformans]
MAKAKKQTPMMEQYTRIKAEYSDAFLFYRLGDFYELFNEDAIEASKILEITLTSRNKNADDPVPMCGVPYHSATDYIKRLIEAGHKVAICEQMEDPKTTKGMVDRQVVRVITPGTISEEEGLALKDNNYLAAIHLDKDLYTVAFIDVSTGESRITHSDDWTQFVNELQGVGPTEIVFDSEAEAHLIDKVKNEVTAYFSPHVKSQAEASPIQFQLEAAQGNEIACLELLSSYLYSVQKQALDYLQEVERYELSQYLQMNQYAKHQLELTRSLRTQRRQGSLLWFIDRTETAMGGRLLKQWLDKPLLNQRALEVRHNRVEQLLNHYFERVELVEQLKHIYDLERLVSKISTGSANARDIDQLRRSLTYIPRINQILVALNTSIGDVVFPQLNEFSEVYDKIDQVLQEDLPISITEGNLIKAGYHQQLDTYRDALENGQQWLADLQAREREATGLNKLKVGYNKVFGYYIEVSRLYSDQLDSERYHRKQTLTNAERFITDELKEIERTILDAQEKSVNLEYDLFIELREFIKDYTEALQNLTREIATLDVLASFASLSEDENYVRAELVETAKDLTLVDSRHPVVEHLVGQEAFVPNDVQIQPDKYLLLLTGPNMSGKSTYMRQVAFCLIMNQIGCFVPAKEASLPLIDQIFTRIGSSDDISSGQSTFMVEMMETNIALEQATPRSLLLFDEIGRGTATYDGMALAEGILHYISEHVQAATIFSTHYHELTDLEASIPELRNIHVGATEEAGELIFHHKILPGPADKSYGIHVAKLAGLPPEVIQRSQVALNKLEARAKKIKQTDTQQLSLFDVSPEEPVADVAWERIAEAIEALDINHMTPLEAMQNLAKLQEDVATYRKED